MFTETLLGFKILQKASACIFEGFPVMNAFSLRQAGNMSPKYGSGAQENFEKFCSTVGISPTNRVHIHPAHGNKVTKTGRYHRGALVVCDGLITTEGGLALSLFPADCFPVVITNEKGDFVGLIHGGRKSVEQGIIANAVELAKRFVKSSVDLFVAIGPGIRCCCYGTDLQLEITKQLLKMGVRKIFFSGVCTYCSDDEKGQSLFFSHRRSEKTGEPEGRFAALVALP